MGTGMDPGNGMTGIPHYPLIRGLPTAPNSIRILPSEGGAGRGFCDAGDMEGFFSFRCCDGVVPADNLMNKGGRVNRTPFMKQGGLA